MTATTTARTGNVVAGNPHHIGTVITAWAIPLVFIGAMWGAGHDPEHSSWSAFALITIVALHLVNRIRRAVWNRRHGAGK